MEPNLEVSIYVRSSIKFLHVVPFHQQIWPPRAILVSDWLLFKKIFSSETAWQNGAKLGIDGPWVCPFQNCVRQPHPPFKMAAVFLGNDYLPLEFASGSFYCQVSDTASVG